jgi:dinuclear metal center YbgI/SA1388 family protein
MIIKDVISELENLAPLSYAEDFDNVGLLVGDYSKRVSGILVTLDTLEEVVDEAINNNCNLIVTFHPIIFKGLKTLTGKNYVEKTVLKAIKNDIAIYAIHTALDNCITGVNDIICNKLGLKNKSILIPQKSTIKKLTTYVPIKDANKLRQELFNAGAGAIGNYDNCSFNIEGHGTFKGNINSTPVIGEKGVLHKEKETQINITFEKHLEAEILRALFSNHPYEEVAYEIITLNNTNQNIGIGMIGELENELEEEEALKFIKTKLNTELIRHSKPLNKKIKRIAVLGGSGSFAIKNAIQNKADLFITADLKYHDFFSAEKNILLADVGHYESEQYTKNYLHEYLSEKFTNFAVLLSKINTNPVKYF